jgi:TonB family protein
MTQRLHFYFTLMIFVSAWCPSGLAKDGKSEPVYEAGPDFVRAEILQPAVVKYPDNLKLSQDVECIFAVELADDGKPVHVFTIQMPDPNFLKSITDAVANSNYKPGVYKKKPVKSLIYLHILYHADQSDTRLETLTIASKENHPKVISTVDPRFPETAEMPKPSGIVGVAFMVDLTGKPLSVHVFQSMRVDYDKEAVKAVEQYRFRPAEVDGKPVPVWSSLFINFQYH